MAARLSPWATTKRPPAGETYTRGTPNSWAPISADDKLGMVYIPTGNATPDYYAGHRTELDNKFSGSVLAINADNGHLVWNFQTTHYDVWDYDVASQPSLLDLKVKGETVPVLVQPTKRGQNFVLDRRTGKPVFDVQELPAPQGGVEDPARLSKTQPHSTGMPNIGNQTLKDMCSCFSFLFIKSCGIEKNIFLMVDISMK